MYLDQYELAILRSLRKTRLGWLNVIELTETTELPGWAIRSTLRRLRGMRLIDRGQGPGLWGHYSITERGLTELAATEQLRLVK